ncbi:hypothetical protein B0T22DRAFT_437889 [Podospora appendiculata]|uniref:Chromo domain-containing protein n=1 Tax=Podospora appendiculata TaxID=314037 RepID=A0AAE1CHS4_9PEZI|nr:hypothetical protein B0T22DRAFT_437889 [Podospora appendiculata]
MADVDEPIMISDDESDYSDSDSSQLDFPPIESLLRSGVETSYGALESEAEGPPVAEGAYPGDEVVLTQQLRPCVLQRSPSPRSLPSSQTPPRPSPARAGLLVGPSLSGDVSFTAGQEASILGDDICDIPLQPGVGNTSDLERLRPFAPSPRGGSSNEAEKLLNSRNPPRKDEDRTETGDDKDCLPSARRSRGREGTLCRDSADEGDSDEDELAGAEPPVQPSDSQDRNSGRDIGRHRHCDTNDEEDYRPIEDSDAEHSWDDDVVQPPRRKRRRISTSILASGGTAAQQQTHYADSRSRQIQRSFQPPKRRIQRSIPSPPSSWGSILEEETVKAPVAKFEEWPVSDAVFKRVTLDGVQTIQLQFTWVPCAKHGKGYHETENQGSASPAKRHRPARQGSKRSTKDEDTTANSKSAPRRQRYTPQDDAKICQLKDQGLSWLAIAEQFPGRSPGAIEQRYYTKLQTNPTHGAPQLCDDPQTPLVVDNAGEEEWEVEEICNYRKPEDGGLEFLVKWKGGDETWEPFENVAETEVLDKYERFHGPRLFLAFQALFNYVLLTIVYLPLTQYWHRPREWLFIVWRDGWKCFILSLTTNKDFSSPSAKQQHVADSNKHHVCEKCPDEESDFDSKDDLNERLETDHNYCTYCKRAFNSPDCRRYFNSTSDLKNHLKTHAEKTTQCPGCSQMFVSDSAMVLHLEAGISLIYFQPGKYTCNNDSGFDFKCRTCGTPFSFMSAVLQHAESDSCNEHLIERRPLGRFLRYLRAQF